jgi:hypothetical protein
MNNFDPIQQCELCLTSFSLSEALDGRCPSCNSTSWYPRGDDNSQKLAQETAVTRRRGTVFHERTLRCPRGEVTVRSSDGDVRRALESALAQLESDSQS